MGKKNIVVKIAFLICVFIISVTLFPANNRLKNGYLGVSAKSYTIEMVRNELIVAKARVDLAGDGMILFSLTENTDMADMKRILKSFTHIFSRNEKEQPELAKLKENSVIREFRTGGIREEVSLSMKTNSLARIGKEIKGESGQQIDQNQLMKNKLDMNIQTMEKILGKYRAVTALLNKNK